MHIGQQKIFFLTNFILFFTGNGLYPLLPLFAGGFGAHSTTIGLFMASLSATSAVGALTAGRLLLRFSSRTLYVIIGAVGVAALLCLSQARAMLTIVLAMDLVWFVGGFLMAIVNVLTGLTVSPEVRGRAFSRLYLASPLAAIFGGAALGAMVGVWDYKTAFLILAAMWVAIPIMGLLLSSTIHQTPSPMPSSTMVALPPAASRSFQLLLLGAIAIFAAIQLRNVSAFMQMQEAGFSAAAISSTTVTAGMVTVPLAIFIGSVSDRIARRPLMVIATTLVVLTLVLLAGASELWHFACGIALLLAATAVLRPATTALAADLLPPTSLQSALPLIEASVMGTSIAVTAGAGYGLERFGPYGITLISSALLLLSALSLVLLCTPRLVGASCPIAVRAWRIRGIISA